jgi:hypothetical protein
MNLSVFASLKEAFVMMCPLGRKHIINILIVNKSLLIIRIVLSKNSKGESEPTDPEVPFVLVNGCIVGINRPILKSYL